MSSFPRDTFIGIGIAIIMLAVVQIGCGIGILSSLCPASSIQCSALASMYGLLFFGPAVMNVITGGLGIGTAGSHVGHRMSGLKIGFMVMCIMSAFGTVGAGYYLFNTIAAITPYREYHEGQGLLAALWIGGIANVVLFILSVVGASYSCCCSPVGDGEEGSVHFSLRAQGIQGTTEDQPTVPYITLQD